jgi:hypothetical protein
VATVLRSTAAAAREVAQTPKQALSLAIKPRSLPSQQADAEVASAPGLGPAGMAALPPYRAAALVRQFLAVRRPVAQSPYQVLRLVVKPGTTSEQTVRVTAHRGSPKDRRGRRKCGR